MTVATEKARGRAVVKSGMREWTDEQLIVRYRDQGDPEVFAILVSRYEQEIYSYLRRYLGNSEMAEDAFQATFLQLHLKCNQFEPDRRLKPWLYMIATNQAIDLQRRMRRHRLPSLDRVGPRDGESNRMVDLLLSQEPNPVDELEGRENQHRIRESLDALPEHLKLAVNLVYFQGLKYREAADVLSIPVGTVKSRLHSALVKLNEAWNSASTR